MFGPWFGTAFGAGFVTAATEKFFEIDVGALEGSGFLKAAMPPFFHGAPSRPVGSDPLQLSVCWANSDTRMYPMSFQSLLVLRSFGADNGCARLAAGAGCAGG